MGQQIFKAEVLPLRNKLFLIAKRMLNEEQDAEDAVQEALLKLWHLRDSLHKYDSITAYSITITKNICIDYLRIKNKHESIDEVFNWEPDSDNPYLKLERKNTEEILEKIIERLPTLQQAIIKMKDIEEYEIDKIAEITGTNNESVRMNLSRARKKVREEFLKYTK